MATDEISVEIFHEPGAHLRNGQNWVIELGNQKVKRAITSHDLDSLNISLPCSPTARNETIKISLNESCALFCHHAVETFQGPKPSELSPFATVSIPSSSDWAKIALVKLPKNRLISQPIPCSPYDLRISLTQEIPSIPHSLMISFRPPFYHGPFDAQISHFLIETSLDPTFSEEPFRRSETFEIDFSKFSKNEILWKTISHDGLVGNKTIYLRVCSVSPLGQSPFVTSAFQCPVWPPSKILDLSLQQQQEGQTNSFSSFPNVCIFKQPKFDGGSEITHFSYVIVALENVNTGTESLQKMETNEFSGQINLSQLKYDQASDTFSFPLPSHHPYLPELTYSLSLNAVNAQGPSFPSDPIPFSLPARVPDPLFDISHFSLSNGFEFSFSVFPLSGGANSHITHFMVQISSQNEKSISKCFEIPFEKAEKKEKEQNFVLRVEDQDIPTDTTFQVELIAVNRIGKSESVSLTCDTTSSPPGPINSLTLLSRTHTSVKFKWDKPTLSGGLPLTTYTIFWNVVGSLLTHSATVRVGDISGGGAAERGGVGAEESGAEDRDRNPSEFESDREFEIQDIPSGGSVDIYICAHNEKGQGQINEKAFRLEALGTAPTDAPHSINAFPSDFAHALVLHIPPSPNQNLGGLNLDTPKIIIPKITHLRVKYCMWSDSIKPRSDGEIWKFKKELALGLLVFGEGLKEGLSSVVEVDVALDQCPPEKGFYGILKNLPAWTTVFATVAFANEYGVGPFCLDVACGTTFPSVPSLAPLLSISSVRWGVPFTLPEGAPEPAGNLRKQDIVTVTWDHPDPLSTRSAFSSLEICWTEQHQNGLCKSGLLTVPASQGYAVISAHTTPNDKNLTQIMRSASRALTINLRPLAYWEVEGGKGKPDPSLSALIVIRPNPDGDIDVWMQGQRVLVEDCTVVPEIWDNGQPIVLPRLKNCSLHTKCNSLVASKSERKGFRQRFCGQCADSFLEGFCCPKCLYFLCKKCASEEMCCEIQPGIFLPALDAHPLALIDYSSPTPCSNCQSKGQWGFKCIFSEICHLEGAPNFATKNLCFKCVDPHLSAFGISMKSFGDMKREAIRKWAHSHSVEKQSLQKHREKCLDFCDDNEWCNNGKLEESEDRRHSSFASFATHETSSVCFENGLLRASIRSVTSFESEMNDISLTYSFRHQNNNRLSHRNFLQTNRSFADFMEIHDSMPNAYSSFCLGTLISDSTFDIPQNNMMNYSPGAGPSLTDSPGSVVSDQPEIGGGSGGKKKKNGFFKRQKRVHLLGVPDTDDDYASLYKHSDLSTSAASLFGSDSFRKTVTPSATQEGDSD